MIDVVFNGVWGILLLAAVVAQLLYADKPKIQAGFVSNVLVYVPFLLIFGLYYSGWRIGNYTSIPQLPIAGAAAMILGLTGYLLSHVSLGRNWSLSASIRDGHKLVTTGLYRLVRHPMYFFMLLIYLGSGLLLSGYVVLLLTPVVGLIYYFRARAEERLLTAEFPDTPAIRIERKCSYPVSFERALSGKLPERGFQLRRQTMPSWLGRLFGNRFVAPKGILLYGSVQEVIRAQKALESHDFQARLVAPPPEVRVGCDLAVEFDPLEQEAIESVLQKEEIPPERIVSVKEMLPDILKETAFVEMDGYLMAKAGNMKITIEKRENRIVNISGGGCPDVPYVAHELHNARIDEAKNPIDIGNSLCTYLLQIAFDSLKERVTGQ